MHACSSLSSSWIFLFVFRNKVLESILDSDKHYDDFTEDKIVSEECSSDINKESVILESDWLFVFHRYSSHNSGNFAVKLKPVIFAVIILYYYILHRSRRILLDV